MILNTTRYRGEAVFQQDGQHATLAHQGPADLFVLNKAYEFNGILYKVVGTGKSDYVPSITVVKLLAQ